MKFATIAALAAIACVTPAHAYDLTATANTGYANSTGSVNEYHFGGQALMSWQTAARGLQTQANLDYRRFSASSLTVNLLDIGGDIFWRDGKGTFGASLTHHRFDAGGASGIFTFVGNASVTSYGAFGEYYFTPDVTLKFKAGGYGGDAKGYYLGSDAGWYLTPNLAVDMGVHYLKVNSLGNEKLFDLGIEYLPIEALPLSVSLNYRYTSVSPGGTGSTIGFALKYRFGGAGTLLNWDRRGAVSWNGGLPL